MGGHPAGRGARVGGCASADEALEALREFAPDAELLSGIDDEMTGT